MKAQILIVTLFALSMAMTVLFFLYLPVRNQALRIKKMEQSFFALANSISGLELSFYETQKSQDVSPSFGEETKVIETREVDPIYCNNLSPCKLYSVIKIKRKEWQRSIRYYYLCTPSTCDYRKAIRKIISSQGIEKETIRTLFYQFKD